MLDIKIVNGKLLDMDQNRLIEAELGIKDGKIDKIGTIDEDARIILDAEGAVVSRALSTSICMRKNIASPKTASTSPYPCFRWE